MNKLTRAAERAIRQQQRYDKALAEIERLKVVNLDLYEACKVIVTRFIPKTNLDSAALLDLEKALAKANGE